MGDRRGAPHYSVEDSQTCRTSLRYRMGDRIGAPDYSVEAWKTSDVQTSLRYRMGDCRGAPNYSVEDVRCAGTAHTTLFRKERCWCLLPKSIPLAIWVSVRRA